MNAPGQRVSASGARQPQPQPQQQQQAQARAWMHRHAIRRFGGSLHHDLFKLGLAPCAAVAIALGTGLTMQRLDATQAAFQAEGQAIAQQLAVFADDALQRNDLPALQLAADAMLRGGRVQRVEIAADSALLVAAGAARTETLGWPVFDARPSQSPAVRIQAFRDPSATSRERARAIAAGLVMVSIGLLLAWAWVRHTARLVSQPLRRISQTVSALRDGHFDARCDVLAPAHATEGEAARRIAPTHELASLAQDVDLLAEHLQLHRQRSEQQVQEATAVALQRMAEAEQAALSRARFLAAASHDLRQPLHAMGLFIDGLLASANAQQRPAVLRLQEGAEFMGVLLDDLLEISRLDAQVLTPAIGAVSLQVLFDQLNAQQASAAGAARVRLLWKDQGLAVRSDAALLARIVGNLVSNAIHHSAPYGTVLVAARRRGAKVRIEVRDNGVGIAPIHHARIFEEFYQVANAERDRRQGFGLGLSICARIAALLGSRIELSSALRAGSTFALLLPAASALDVAPPAIEEALPAPLQGLRCLVVDDDPVILQASTALLTQWGCTVQALTGACEAIELLGDGAHPIDVLLCDLQLAGRDDGMDVIEAARRLQPEAMTVLVSGATGPESLQRLRQEGVTLLTKPVAPAKLRALLSTRRRPAA